MNLNHWTGEEQRYFFHKGMPPKKKGQFVSLCAMNRNIGFARMIKEIESGYIRAKHCICHVCEAERVEYKLTKCVSKNYPACKRMTAGIIMRSYHSLFGME